MAKEEVTLISLLTIAIALIKIGMDLISKGQYLPALGFIVSGIVIMGIGVFLYTRGIINKVLKKVVR